MLSKANLYLKGYKWFENSLGLCYGLNITLPSNLYVDTLIPHVAVFGGGTSKELIKVKWGHKD